MQRRRSSSVKRQQTPQTELVPGPSKSKRSLSSERRYSRQYLPNSSVSGGPTDSKIKPHTGEMKTKPLTAFRTPSRNSSVIWSRLTPPSRAPTSFAQVELRKKLLEENLKLAKSLSGLKRQTAASKNSWQLVRNHKSCLFKRDQRYFGVCVNRCGVIEPFWKVYSVMTGIPTRGYTKEFHELQQRNVAKRTYLLYEMKKVEPGNHMRSSSLRIHTNPSNQPMPHGNPPQYPLAQENLEQGQLYHNAILKELICPWKR